MTTASMSPLLEPGDFMLVAPLDGNERPGDLLLLPVSPMNPAKRVHRLVALEGGTAITRGDANPTPDLERLALSAALGRVVAVGKGGAWRRVDGPGARLKGRIVAAGFRALDAAAARVGETPRLDSALGRAAGRLRRSDLPWRLAAALGRGARRRWTELWLACEERERKPGTSWDWLRAAWARWAARV